MVPFYDGLIYRMYRIMSHYDAKEAAAVIKTDLQQILQEMGNAVPGKEKVIYWMLAAILARGHILLEDIPGVGKTSLALTFAKALGLGFGRVQFTPDVTPSDVVGYCVPDLKNGEMTYKNGAVMCNLFLADELNRATSRTQSALLEAMQEGQVTVDGICHKMPKPFVVIATQNPAGAGIQKLPDSQMDRFALRLRMGYPAAEDEIKMLLRQERDLRPLLTAEELCRMQEETENVYLSEAVAAYAVALMAATRKSIWISRGGSPRATVSTVAVAKAVAYLQGRDFVIPEDVQRTFMRTMPHRLQPREEKVLCRIVLRVRKPKL